MAASIAAEGAPPGTMAANAEGAPALEISRIIIDIDTCQPSKPASRETASGSTQASDDKATGSDEIPSAQSGEIPRVTSDELPRAMISTELPRSVDSGRSARSNISGVGEITCKMWLGYAWGRSKEHAISVGMISGYLIIFYVGMLRKPPPFVVFVGLFFVWMGITFFMEGFMSGIMPLAEILGRGIPNKFSVQSSMVTTFLLGIACTLAEPAMGALELAGSMVKVDKAPYLWYMLTKWNFFVFISVGLGVGFAALIGTLRLLRGWPLKPLIYLSTASTIGLTVLADYTGLKEIVGLAWDAGAVTTGAVTVPIILGLGIGIMVTDRKNKGNSEEANPLDSFGIVTLASLYPVVGVLCLGFLCKAIISVEEIKEHSRVVEMRKATDKAVESLWDKSPLLEFVYASRAVVPLILLVILLIKVKLKVPLPYIQVNIKDVKFEEVGQQEELSPEEQRRRNRHTPPDPGCIRVHVLVGVAEAYLGLVIFNVGLRHGQGPLGEQVGAAVPALYSQVDAIDDSPAFDDRGLGIAVVCVFTFFMAFTATYAEPALNAMGMTTEQLTKGAFKKTLLLFAVACGVSAGVMFGVLRMIYGWSLTLMLAITYPVAICLTVTSAIEYVSVGWDCAGVTTSSITVPLVLAMGIGVGDELGVQDSFGLLAMGSIGPIISVLIAGRLAKLNARIRGKPT